jgi:hypothetical protein
MIMCLFRDYHEVRSPETNDAVSTPSLQQWRSSALQRPRENRSSWMSSWSLVTKEKILIVKMAENQCIYCAVRTAALAQSAFECDRVD